MKTSKLQNLINQTKNLLHQPQKNKNFSEEIMCLLSFQPYNEANKAYKLISI